MNTIKESAPPVDLYDYQIMLQAIKIGELGRINAPPNPWVGCVIVKNGIVLAEGFHAYAGAPHAEVAALAKTQDAAGSTAYVTLEPCAHHGRTPPCTDALIKAHVARVVIGTLDPDSRVSGNGVRILKNAGIEVVTGVAEKEVRRSLGPYLYQRTHQKMFTVVKVACSIDGCMCAEDRTSQWITGEDARIDAHKLRAESQAILTGVGTTKLDNPKLNVRAPVPLPMNPPIRVVLDSHGNSDPLANVFNPAYGPSLLLTTPLCPKERLTLFKEHGVDVEIVKEENGKLCLFSAMDFLARKNIIQAMVEGGPTLTSAFIELGLFQQLSAYIGPKVIGGKGIHFSQNIPWNSLPQALSLKLRSHKVLGDTVRLDYTTEDSQ